MKKLFTFLFIICILNSCSEDEGSVANDTPPVVTDGSNDDVALYDAPYVRSYRTYISQNSVTLNGFVDHSSVFFSESDAYKVGFILRAGDQNDSSNDQVIELEEEVDYFTGFYKFKHSIDGLTPNTTYYYTAFTKNGASEEDDWESFTTSAIACDYTQNNYYSLSGIWKNANVSVTDPQCCDEGNVGFSFGTWPDIVEISFNELSNGYPQTGQYFGVEYSFDGTYITKDLVKSSNQVLIEYMSITETELFVENDGETITFIFCDTMLKDGEILNGKVSVQIP